MEDKDEDSKPIQEYLDEFFNDMVIFDVIVAPDIPICTFNGNEQRRVSADLFFKDDTRMNLHRIESYIPDSDAILWIFDSFLVFELDSSKDDTRQFIVLQHVHNPDDLEDRFNAMRAAIKILALKEQLKVPMMELIVFKEAWDFFLKHHDHVLEISKRKYRFSETGVQESLREANAAYKNGDYAIAFKKYQKLSEQGYAIAQFNLGNMYLEGEGVSRNYTEAMRWYLLAAEQGVASAQFNLGQLFKEGKGVSQDYKEAMKWYRSAAEQGHASAQTIIGIMYALEEGVPRDYNEATKWFRRAAEQGDVRAQTQLGKMYVIGQGVPQGNKEAMRWLRLAAEQSDAVAQRLLGYIIYEGQGAPQDYKEAAKWLRLAAEQGDTSAQIYFGVMHAKGQGVPEDMLQAHKWFNIAAVVGNEDAQKNRKFAESKMSLEQIEEAQALAREWLTKRTQQPPANRIDSNRNCISMGSDSIEST